MKLLISRSKRKMLFHRGHQPVIVFFQKKTIIVTHQKQELCFSYCSAKW